MLKLLENTGFTIIVFVFPQTCPQLLMLSLRKDKDTTITVMAQ